MAAVSQRRAGRHGAGRPGPVRRTTYGIASAQGAAPAAVSCRRRFPAAPAPLTGRSTVAELTFALPELDGLEADALVVGTFSTPDGVRLAAGADAADAALDGRLLPTRSPPSARPATRTTWSSSPPPAPPRSRSWSRPASARRRPTVRRPTPQQVARAAGAAVRALGGKARVACTLGLAGGDGAVAELAAAAAEGALLGAYSFGAYRSGDGAKTAPPGRDHPAGARPRGRGAGRGRPPGRRRRRRRRAGPRPGQHPAERPAAGRVRPAGRGGRPGRRPRGRGARRGGAGGRRLRRRARRRRRLAAPAPAGPDQARRHRAAGRPGRQGHHVRLRRHLDQAGRRDGPDEGRHGRRGRDRRGDDRGRRASTCRSR